MIFLITNIPWYVCNVIYKGKRPYKGGIGGRVGHKAHGVCVSSDKRVLLNNHGNPPYGIDWVEDKFYEQEFYANFLAEQNTRLHELQNNRSSTLPTAQKVTIVVLRIL